MQKYRLAIAFVVLAGAAGTAAALVVKRNQAVPAAQGVRLPDITRTEIESLEITRPNDPTVRLEKRDGAWRVTAPVDARADEANVTQVLEKLDELEVVGEAANNRSLHERLEVDPAHGVHVIARRGTTTIADLWIGAARGSNTLVRKHDEAQVAVVAGSLRWVFDRELKDWRDKVVTDFSPDDVRTATFTTAAGTWRFVKRDGAWAQADGEAPIERFGSSRVQTLIASLTRIRATNFGAANVTAEQAGIGPNTVTLEAQAPDAGTATTVVLHVGNALPDSTSEFYVTREGDPTIFVVSSYTAERLKPALTEFQTPVDAGAAPPPPPSPMGGMPGGMPGMGGPGGGQIPPEVMRQLQQQMAAQGMGGH